MLNDPEKDSLLQLSIDEQSRFQLNETSKWARFLAIVGMAGFILLFLAAVVLSVTSIAGSGAMESVALMGAYLLLGAFYVYPVISLYRFGKGMKLALISNDQLLMNNALRHLKNCFLYIGIVTIILLVVYGILIIFGLGAAILSFQ